MKRIIFAASLSLALATGCAHAQTTNTPAKPPVLQQPVLPSQAANGVIVQAIQPTTWQVETSSITSLLWIYDTNTKQVMLCSGRTNLHVDCTRAVALNWTGN